MEKWHRSNQSGRLILLQQRPQWHGNSEAGDVSDMLLYIQPQPTLGGQSPGGVSDPFAAQGCRSIPHESSRRSCTYFNYDGTALSSVRIYDAQIFEEELENGVETLDVCPDLFLSPTCTAHVNIDMLHSI